MFYPLTIVFIPYTLALSVYTNSKFTVNNIQLNIENISYIDTLMKCACECYNNDMCLTATYFETYQQCALYSVSLDQGVLHVIPRNLSITTLTFTNKSLSKSLFNSIFKYHLSQIRFIKIIKLK